MTAAASSALRAAASSASSGCSTSSAASEVMVLAFVAYMSTYSWPESCMSSYMISSVIERSTKRSLAMPS